MSEQSSDITMKEAVWKTEYTSVSSFEVQRNRPTSPTSASVENKYTIEYTEISNKTQIGSGNFASKRD